MSWFSTTYRRGPARATCVQDVHLTVPRPGAIQLRHRKVFAEPSRTLCRDFLQRIFYIEEVSSVCIEPARGEATIEFQDEGASSAILKKLADAFNETTSRQDRQTPVHLHLSRKGTTPVRVFRYESTVSTWKVIHDLPGRTRLGHDQLIGRPKAASYIEQELRTTFGVLESKAKSRTGTVLIRFNERVVTTPQLLQILEGMLHDFDNPRPRDYCHTEVGTALSYSTLVLAAAGQFVYPPLLPLSGVVLVLSNLDTARAAWRELRAKQLGVSVLYATIVAATLATGGFFTAALMSWFIHFWDRRSHRQLSAAQHQLLLDFRRRSRFAWLCREGVEVEIPVEQLEPGDLVVVQPGEMIPADGIVATGAATVDERLVRGVEGLTNKAAGETVFANSLVFEGSVQVRVGKKSENSRAASIVRAIEDASTPPPAQLKRRGQQFANRTVTPTLAAAGVGLAVGDLGTALAILRPDYWSGPGMSGPLGKLHDVVACARRGIVVRDAAALDRFAKTDLLLVDLQCALRGYQTAQGPQANGADNGLLELRRQMRRLRGEGALRVGLVSEARTSYVAQCADFLEVDFFEGDLADGDKATLVHDHAQQGKKVTFVGDCGEQADAAKQAHVAISISDIEELHDDPADVFLLESQLPKLGEFWAFTQTHERRRRAHESCVLLPNLCCVAGAFVLGFTSFHTVLITNLGVYTVYRSGMKWLRKLQQETSDDLELPPVKAGPRGV